MLSLSVNRWSFTDKLFKINKLSVEGPFFRTNQNFQRQGLNQPHYFLGNFFCIVAFLLPEAGPILYLDKNS